jgi:hypothetical protein
MGGILFFPVHLRTWQAQGKTESTPFSLTLTLTLSHRGRGILLDAAQKLLTISSIMVQ